MRIKMMTVVATMITISSMVGLIQTVPAGALASPGNNGTLKVHEKGTPSGTQSNDPQVCVFNFEGFGFDEGQTGRIVITPQGGDSTATDTAVLDFGPATPAGYYATAYLNDGGQTLANGHYKSTLYGKDAEGNYTIDLKAKSKVFKVECEDNGGSQHQAHLSVADECNYTTHYRVFTFTNSGDVEGTATINGETVVVPAGQTVVKSVYTGDQTTPVTVIIDGKTVIDNSEICIIGGGGGGSTTPHKTPTRHARQQVRVSPNVATPTAQQQLPDTAGTSDLGLAVITGSLSITAMVGSLIRRVVMTKPF